MDGSDTDYRLCATTETSGALMPTLLFPHDQLLPGSVVAESMTRDGQEWPTANAA